MSFSPASVCRRALLRLRRGLRSWSWRKPPNKPPSEGARACSHSGLLSRRGPGLLRKHKNSVCKGPGPLRELRRVLERSWRRSKSSAFELASCSSQPPRCLIRAELGRGTPLRDSKAIALRVLVHEQLCRCEALRQLAPATHRACFCIEAVVFQVLKKAPASNNLQPTLTTVSIAIIRPAIIVIVLRHRLSSSSSSAP